MLLRVPVSLTSESYPDHRDRWAFFANKMCLWIFDFSLPNESAKDLKVQSVWKDAHSFVDNFSDTTCWERTEVDLNLLANQSVQGKVVRCYLKSTRLYPPLLLYLRGFSMLLSTSLLSFVPSYYNNNAKTFNCLHEMEFKKGRKRGIAVLYLFEHSLISTHLSKLKQFMSWQGVSISQSTHISWIQWYHIGFFCILQRSSKRLIKAQTFIN